MAIETGMYRNVPMPSNLGSSFNAGAARGMEMQKMAKMEKKQEQINDAFKRNMIKKKDGSIDFNRAGLMSEMAAIDGPSALQLQDKFQAMDANRMKYQIARQSQENDEIGRIVFGIDGPETHELAKRALIENGYDPAMLGEKYDPNVMKMRRAQFLSLRDKLDYQAKAFDTDLKVRTANRADDQFSFQRLKWDFDRRKQEEKDKEFTQGQADQAGLYNMGVSAEEQYRKAVGKGSTYDPTEAHQWIDDNSWAPNWMKDKKAVEAQAAQSAWVEAFLRDASGAAIPPDERMSYAKDFFPRPGDSDQVVKNKRRLRMQKMENARIGAGGDKKIKRRTIKTPGFNERYHTNEIDWKE